MCQRISPSHSPAERRVLLVPPILQMGSGAQTSAGLQADAGLAVRVMAGTRSHSAEVSTAPSLWPTSVASPLPIGALESSPGWGGRDLDLKVTTAIIPTVGHHLDT